jgi:hypothetical protein
MSEHPEYPIKKIADFLTIPPEKLQHALKDFFIWLEFARVFQAAVRENSEVSKLNVDLSQFVWLDDGKHDIIPVVKAKPPRKARGQ